MEIVTPKDQTTNESEMKETFEDKKIQVAPHEELDALHNSIKDSKKYTIHTPDKIETVEVTDEEKSEYLNSILENRRFYLKSSIFGGRISVTFRCRTILESEAIKSYMYRQVRKNSMITNDEYTGLLTRCMLLCQIEEINGVKNKELEEPLFFEEHDGKLVPPAWESRLASIACKPEAVIAALGDELREFEKKYWSMTASSKDANFWLPAKSTEE